jgi:putative transcriptional regulator
VAALRGPCGQALAGGLAALVAITAAGAAAGQGRRPADRAGRLLVATDELQDSRFHHTVIYMVQHDARGAMGLVVNRPIAEVRLADLLARFGVDNQGVSGRIRVYYGGPVEPSRVFVLHSIDYVGAATRVLNGGVALTTEPDVLEAMARGRGPLRSLFVLGYAGWAPGQLEGEIRGGHWVSVPAEPGLLFDEDPEKKWERAMAQRRIEL